MVARGWRWVGLAGLLGLVLVAGCSGNKDPGGKQGPAASPPALTPMGPTSADAIAENNRGVALMGQFKYDDAYAVFAKVVEQHPGWLDAQVNLGIAALNRQQPGDEEAALATFARVLAADAHHLRAKFCSGILLTYRAKHVQALEYFNAVVTADPRDADATYWCGKCLFDLEKYEAALPWFEQAEKLDPNLRSATMNRFQTLQRLGRHEEVKAVFADFERMVTNPQTRVVEIKYTRMGPKAEVVAVLPEVKPAVRPAGPLFADAAPLPLVGGTAPSWIDAAAAGQFTPSLTTADLDGDGHSDLFVAASVTKERQRQNAVLLRRGKEFASEASHSLAGVTDVRAALWGDYDNDGLTDVYLCRRGPNQLWRQTERGKWQDVTAATKTAGGDFDTVAGRLFDADHDGDLDLLLVRANGPTELLNNNRDGTFKPIATEQGLAGDGRPARQVLVADLDSDRDLDFVILHAQPPHVLWLNDRGWKYRPADGFAALAAANVSAIVAADADANGRLELYAATPDGITRWEADRDGKWQAMITTRLEPAADAAAPRQLVVADLDGNGQLELLAQADKHLWIVELGGKSPSPPQHLDAAAGPGLLANLDGDAPAGPAWVQFEPGRGLSLRNPGAGRFPFAALQFTGKEDKANEMRSNASGIGLRVITRVGSQFTAFHPLAAASDAGQSLQPLAVGLIGAKELEVVSIVWPDGVSQTELALAAGQRHVIPEVQRQTSSCPVLFCWNGEQFEFVTDLLGVGGLGFNLGREEYAVPRPWENVLLPPGMLVPRDGRLQLKLGEPMEEVCYLDALRLVAYDLPSGWQMTLDERFAEQGPAPTGRPLFHRREWLPTAATNDRGEDVLRRVTTADRVAAEPGRRDERFLGRTQEHTLTLRFAEPLEQLSGDIVLVLDGWIEYPYSQTMFAAWQAGAEYQSATLEARGDGAKPDSPWQTVLARFGYPAGMPRQMALPIPRDKLPPGTRELRLRTNVEVYWDRAAVIGAEPCPAAVRHVLPCSRTELAEVGFARRTTGPQRTPHYDYQRRSPFWDTRHPAGWYTQFGPVDELVAKVDDAVAIFGPGEEIHAEFTVPTTLAAGMTRRYVLESHGWCKDLDLYTQHGETVAPLPRRATDGTPSPAVDTLHRKYQTRYRAGY